MPNCIDQFRNEQDIRRYLDESEDNIIICLEFEDGRQQYYCESRSNLLRMMSIYDDDDYGEWVMNYPRAADLRDNFIINKNAITRYLDSPPYGEFRDTDTLLEIVSSNKLTMFQFWKYSMIGDFRAFLEGESRFCKLTIQMKIDNITLMSDSGAYVIIHSNITGVDGDFEIEGEDFGAEDGYPGAEEERN